MASSNHPDAPVNPNVSYNPPIETESKPAFGLARQEGGTHYKDMGLEPFEVTLANFGYAGLRAAVYTKVLKYLTRNKGNHATHIQDIKKAMHCLEIQLEAAEKERGNLECLTIPSLKIYTSSYLRKMQKTS